MTCIYVLATNLDRAVSEDNHSEPSDDLSEPPASPESAAGFDGKEIYGKIILIYVYHYVL